MVVELIIPIDTLKGKLREDGFYFRVSNGKQIVQKCPKKWTDTPARKAAREKFIERFAQSRKTASLKVERPKENRQRNPHLTDETTQRI